MFSAERLTFVLLTAQHKDIFTPLLMDNQMMRYITGYPLSLLEATERYERHLSYNLAHNDVGYYLIFHKENLIGYTKFTPYETDAIEIGYAILPEYRKKGYAKESIQTMIAEAKSRLYAKAVGLCDAMNTDSINLLKYFGFTPRPDTFNPSTVILTLNL